jgi:beta-glucanase (GH16 family)
MKKGLLLGIAFAFVLDVSGQGDRDLWVSYLDKVARPVMKALAEDKLHATMPVVLSVRIDSAAFRRQTTYLEAFGRTFSGIARWLDNEDGSAEEMELRRQYRAWALKAVANAVNPAAKDYMIWKGGQPLVDASFFASGLIRCPWVWQHLDAGVKKQVVAALLQTRGTMPSYNNWLLFPAVIEAFFCKYGLEYDAVRIDYAIREFSQHWYLGDGTFTDGPAMRQDYYNSFVIQPFLLTVLDVVGTRYTSFAGQMGPIAQRYAELQERMIGVDGSYPLTGRSITYRCGAFHALAEMAARRQLPASLSPGQVRAALTAVIKRTLGASGTFTADGWMNIGVAGHQEQLADSYITMGSEYLCTEVFQPLGLAATDSFWTAAAKPWTAVKVWGGGDSVRGDHALDLVVAAGPGGVPAAKGSASGPEDAPAVKSSAPGAKGFATGPVGDGWRLVWADEFDKDGAPDAKKWGFENGFVRNHEAQWYQPENAWCSGGKLIIEARKESKPNPLYEPASTNWRKKSPTIEYTSSSLLTKGLHHFKYGRFEMRAKIDVSPGMWPAFWALGEKGSWPSNGEIDIMEYYRRMLLANIATGTATANSPLWFSKKTPLDSLGSPDWATAFHVWRMDWDTVAIQLSVDGRVLLSEPLDSLVNRDSLGVNPFRQPMYLILNLAVGGDAGGSIDGTKFPRRYVIDYVRVYQRSNGGIGALWLDDRGEQIQAHGGGILKMGKTYYWYGEERRQGLDTVRRYVSCYSSEDLLHWKFRGDALSLDDPEQLGGHWVLERPKVYYNAPTKKYVMYFHLDDRRYQFARVGVAVSDGPTGPFQYVRSYRPLDHESRDIGQFIDDDGTAYLVFEDRPFGFRIARLAAADYLSIDKEMCLIPKHMEGGAIVHYHGLYYSIGSLLTGWKANPNLYATATSLSGPWSEFRDIAPPAANTYGSQSTMLLKVAGSRDTTVIFMGDIWRPGMQWESTYLWMPVEIGDGRLWVPAPKEWGIDVKSGKWALR